MFLKEAALGAAEYLLGSYLSSILVIRTTRLSCFLQGE